MSGALLLDSPPARPLLGLTGLKLASLEAVGNYGAASCLTVVAHSGEK